MLEWIRVGLVLIESRVNFLRFISKEYPEGTAGFTLIRNAYNFVQEKFEHIYRLSGEKYLRHLEATAVLTALILKAQDRKDAELIAVALLHDALEDLKWLTPSILEARFGPRVVKLVISVTKPRIEFYEGSEEDRDAVYYTSIAIASEETVIVKLADQLHNLITLWAKHLESQKKKVSFAESFYLPLARKHGILESELAVAILHARAHIGMRTYFSFWFPTNDT